MKNIVIVGFMGTGKSVVAREIANTLDLEYVNTDEIIERKAGMSVNDIFAKKGESYFRQLEREAVMELSTLDNSVIDAGGGAIINELNLKNLKMNGILFCLNAKPSEIYRRIGQQKNRPLLNVPDPVGQINFLLKKRMPYYEKADYQIETTARTKKSVAQEIIGIYKRLKPVDQG